MTSSSTSRWRSWSQSSTSSTQTSATSISVNDTDLNSNNIYPNDLDVAQLVSETILNLRRYLVSEKINELALEVELLKDQIKKPNHNKINRNESIP